MDSIKIIEQYFPNLSEKQFSKLKKLGPLYEDWNQKINVISRKDIENLYQNHVLHSLALAKLVEFKPGTKILDVGTGGGFPGIPLAILFPEVQFHLVDSIAKKIKVVNAVSEELELENVRAEQARAEELKEQYDFVVSRAVTRINKFHSWVANKISKKNKNEIQNGILYLKGGDLTEEMNELNKPHKIYQISEYFSEEFFETKMIIHLPS